MSENSTFEVTNMIDFDKSEQLPRALNVLLWGIRRDLAKSERDLKVASFVFEYRHIAYQFYDDLASSLDDKEMVVAARDEARRCYEEQEKAQKKLEETRVKTSSRRRLLGSAVRSLEADIKARGIPVDMEPQLDEDTIKRIALQVALKSEPGDEAILAATTMMLAYNDAITYLQDFVGRKE